jgi:hypothetical protein
MKSPIANIRYESIALILAPMNPPITMLKVQAIAMILDYFIISILLKYNTNHDTMIAFIDLTVENDSTGNATPGSSQTDRKLTGFSCS